MTEQMYTLEEARRLIGQQECRERGYHSFDEIRTLAGETVRIWCTTCSTDFREVVPPVAK